MRTKIIIAVLVFESFLILTILSLFGSKLKQNKNHTLSPPVSQLNPIVEKRTWKKYMQQVGQKQAYSDFIETYKNAPSYYLRHNSLHYIGELLYEVMGVEGLSICDDSFLYACYHGFFGAMMQNKGLSNIEMMDKACKAKAGSYRSACHHGIGHGVLAYLGVDKLQEATDTCDKLEIKLHAKGCKSGVIMEYNFNNITSHDGNPHVRPLLSSPYYPCILLLEKDQNICYFSQPDWWEYVYNKDYAKIGQLCEGLSGSHRENCYLGTGNIALRSSNFDIKKTIEKCDMFSSVNGNLLCKTGASIRYRIQAEQGNLPHEKVNKLCDSLQGPLKTTCSQNSQIISN